MKKVFALLMAIILCMPLTSIEAISTDDSLISYGEGNEIYGSGQAKVVDLNHGLSGLMISEQSSLIFVGNDDFRIETGNPVKLFEVINDIDKDGYKDIAVYLECEDDYDDFKIISSKTSKVMYATKYTYNVSNDGEVVEKNATIRQIVSDGRVVYLIYNYHLVAIDTKDFNVLFDYEDKDNIWKMAVIDKQVLFTNQLGQLSSLDKLSGEVNYVKNITKPMSLYNKHFSKYSDVYLNTWDIITVNNKIYITSEDAKLHEINVKNGEIVKSITFDKDVKKLLKKTLVKNNNYGIELISTGIQNYNFMSYQVSMLDENRMLVKAYLGHPQNEVVDSESNRQTPHLYVVDLNEFKIKLDISIDQYNLDSSNVTMAMYENQEVLLVPTNATKGKLRIMAYSLNDGTILKQNYIHINDLSKEHVKVNLINSGNQSILLVNNEGIYIDHELKVNGYLNHVSVINKVADVSDGTIVSKSINGKVTQLKKIGNRGKDDVLMTFDVADSYTNNGFEAINYDENNKHLLSLVNETNSNGEVVASHLVILDLNNGAIVADKKVLLEKGRDENNKYFEHYLVGDKIEYFTDMNNDKKPEILVGESIIDGATLTYKSTYHQSFEGAATVIEVGDLNNDGIADLVNVGESEMRIYYSLKNGYDLSYQKSNVFKNYDKKLQNNNYVKVLGDLNHDGVKEFVINGINDKGFQYYQVINGKDLSMRYPLLKDGLIFENNDDSFSVSKFDYNDDGVNDLIYSIYDEEHVIISGATGEEIFRYLNVDYGSDWNNDYGDPYEMSSLVEFNLAEEDGAIKINDLNEDGVNEIAYLIKYYGNYDAGRKNILKILDGKNFKELKSPELTAGNYESNKLISVSGQDKIIYNDGSMSQIYDYRNDSLVAGLKQEVSSAKTLSNGLLQLTDSSGKVFSFDDKRDFELVNFDAEKICDGNLKVNYETDKEGLMYVYDQGNLVEKTTAKNISVKLLTGKHDLIFSYNDGQGKTTHYSTTVVVKKSNLSRYLMIIISLLFVIGGFGLVFYPKYYLMKKAGVKHG